MHIIYILYAVGGWCAHCEPFNNLKWSWASPAWRMQRLREITISTIHRDYKRSEWRKKTLKCVKFNEI